VVEGASALTYDGTTFTTPGQIAFPASQAASSGANVLDDYEEGTWTPVIGGDGGTSGQSYTTQVGTYTKIGRLVYIQCYAALSAKGTITGNVELQGLPFTSSSSTNTNNVFQVGFWQGLGTAYVYISVLNTVNSTVGSFKVSTAATANHSSVMTTTDITDTTLFIISGAYFV
jgi:hypothetical protein